MVVDYVWSRWTGKDEPHLYSFAAISYEAPAEVVAAGHNRCIVTLRDENDSSGCLQPMAVKRRCRNSE
jgi:putative SOS response-associated peptidase YedK